MNDDVPPPDDLDDLDLQSVAGSEIPEVRREAREWLIANNVSDQRAIAAFALGILVFAVAYRSWWAVVLAGCIALVIPFRWMAAPCFRRGDLRRGILWANLGSWYLLFPLVLIVPETLPIAIQNVVGPVILAATYLERRFVPATRPGHRGDRRRDHLHRLHQRRSGSRRTDPAPGVPRCPPGATSVPICCWSSVTSRS